MMNGMASRPSSVGPHLPTGPLTLFAFKAAFDSQQILRRGQRREKMCVKCQNKPAFACSYANRLMVNPGMMTEANICHNSVSPDATAAPRNPPPSISGFCEAGRDGEALRINFSQIKAHGLDGVHRTASWTCRPYPLARS